MLLILRLQHQIHLLGSPKSTRIDPTCYPIPNKRWCLDSKPGQSLIQKLRAPPHTLVNIIKYKINKNEHWLTSIMGNPSDTSMANVGQIDPYNKNKYLFC